MKPRSMWKGAIQLGLITIPVKLYAATESAAKLSFNMLHDECLERIKMPTVCPQHGEISRSQTVKGFEWAKGQYVVITDEDLDSVAIESVKTIVIDRFVPANQLPGITKASYYLAPELIGNKTYAMLRAALEGDKVAIAKIAIRDREALACLSVNGPAIQLSTLYWPDEVRNPAELDLPGEVPLTPAEIKLAKTLISSMTGDFDPAEYVDEYKEGVMKIIEAKVEGGAMPEQPAAAPAKAMPDLIAMLEASVEEAKSRRTRAAA